MPVKPLSFKGDKKPSKKRKHHESSLTSERFDAPQTSSRTQSSAPEDDDSWTLPNQPSDITGPVILVLPTSPPTCLASDSNGRVFASVLENVIENDARTAEPHDVRQVWVAQRVAGMGEGHLGFKGSHGGWLSCDTVGILGAAREARGMEEAFVVEKITQEEDRDEEEHNFSTSQDRLGHWRLRTMASKKGEGDKGSRYVCALTESSISTTATSIPKESHDDHDDNDARQSHQPKKVSISLRGDGEATGSESSSTRVILRMQARFLPQSSSAISEQRAKEKVSRRELETAVGRKLEDHEVKRLKKAKREGGFHEEILDLRAKSRHDKFA